MLGRTVQFLNFALAHERNVRIHQGSHKSAVEWRITALKAFTFDVVFKTTNVL